MRWLSISSKRVSLWIRYYERGSLRDLSLLIDEGVVVRAENGFVRFNDAEEHYDLRRGITLPGFIDIHTHLRGLELSYKEDERSGTLAAARGGFTAVIDMPNTIPRINSLKNLDLKLKALEEKAVVDYGVWVALPQDVEELRQMLSRPGVMGVKIYPEDIPLFEKISREINFDNLRIVIHAEDPDLIRESCEKGFRWVCRGIESEIRALVRVSKAISSRRIPVHVTHVSNTYTAFIAKRMNMSTDTCPHYLYLDSDHERRLGCVAKVNPPLRQSLIRELLLESLKDGTIDLLSTDHAPHTIEEKSRDFSECPSGIASAEFFSSLVLELYHRGFISLDRIIEMSSLKPLEFLNMNMYGCVEPGCVASYTIVDLYRENVISSSNMISRAGNTPYEGMRFRGSTYATIVRGRIVFLDGEFIDLRRGGVIGRF